MVKVFQLIVRTLQYESSILAIVGQYFEEKLGIFLSIILNAKQTKRSIFVRKDEPIAGSKFTLLKDLRLTNVIAFIYLCYLFYFVFVEKCPSCSNKTKTNDPSKNSCIVAKRALKFASQAVRAIDQPISDLGRRIQLLRSCPTLKLFASYSARVEGA